MIFDAYSACRMSSVNCFASPGLVPKPPDASPVVALRWVTDPDSARAKTASAMPVTGTPRSRADLTVQRPVPFCSASSRIRSTSGLPVLASVWRKTCAVISTRKLSRSPEFHSSNTSAISPAVLPRPSRRSW